MNKYRFITNPNLPENNVYHAVISPQFPHFIKALQGYGVSSVFVSQCSDILGQISFHADMLFSYSGNGRYITETSQIKLTESLERIGLTSVCCVNLLPKYPFDILLNNCIVADKIICCEKYTPEILTNGRKTVDVKQGYAKCSCAVVDENSIITDDESIAAALLQNGFDVLAVQKGSVKLNGFDYGFIGGCCGKISKDTLAFCGDISTHSDFIRINSFLRERSVYPLSLTEGELTDIGSIIPITEYC